MLREVSYLPPTSVALFVMSAVPHVSVVVNWGFMDPRGSCDSTPGAQESTSTAKSVLLQVICASAGILACDLQIAKGWKHCLNNALLQLLCREY